MRFSIPQDLSIIGFDDMPFSSVLSPKLTTMAVPRQAMGCYAVLCLHEKIDGDDPTTVKIAVNARIKMGDSVRLGHRF